MTHSKPFQQECRNNGWGARFTCPGCFTDLPHDEWRNRNDACPACGRTVRCTVEEEPLSVCRLVEDQDDAED